MKMKYLIEPFSNIEEWYDYVYNHKWGTIYHLIQWKNAIENTFHWKAEYYILKKEQHICGILPLFLIKGPLLGTRVFSIPYAVYGGILADDKEIELELLKFAQNYTRENEAQYLELRYLYNPGFELPELNSHVTFRKRIEGDPKDIMQSIPRKSRASVRKGYEKFNLTVKINKDLNTLYRLYCLNKRKLGSPVYPKSFFKNLIEEFQENSSIITVYFKNIPVSSVIYFYFRETCFPYFSGYDPKYLCTCANNVLYYELMKESMLKGYRNFDFGRSRINSGPGAFKKHMGFEPIPLHYYYYLNCATKVPNISPTNSKFKPAVKIWKKLPLPLTKIMGPQIVKYVP